MEKFTIILSEITKLYVPYPFTGVVHVVQENKTVYLNEDICTKILTGEVNCDNVISCKGIELTSHELSGMCEKMPDIVKTFEKHN